ncbi:MAG TPA: DUF2085 domain-containing protein [Candidatus Polarisedimenticolia bacterium]
MRTAPTGADLRISLILSAAAVLWLSTALSAPLLQAGGHALPALLARAVFSPVCHQIPGRSFWIDGAPMALCARCTGLASGLLLGCLLVASRAGLCARRLPTPPRAFLLAAFAPMILEAALEQSGAWAGSIWARALTGTMAGFAIAPYAVAATRDLPAEAAGEVRRLSRLAGGRKRAGTC